MNDFCPRMTRIDIISQIKVLKKINIAQTALAVGFLEKNTTISNVYRPFEK